MYKKFFYFLLITVLMYIVSCTTTPITGTRSFILIPFSQEVQLGQEAYSEFLSEQKANINKDPKINEMVSRITKNLAMKSDMPNLKWQTTVINSKEANAFCLPGGKMVVYTGILPLCKNEAGLAAVIGHEMAHAVARHGAQRMTQQLVLNLGLSVASVSFQNSKYRDLIIASLGAGSTVGILLPYSRDNEYEADEIGTIYMARAGYDPNEAVNLWKRFAGMGGSQQPEFLSTHPYSQNRAQRLSSLMPRSMAEYKKSPKYGLGSAL
jgi:metalloendopeptidase OMA1, mitochondrial